MFAYSTTPTMHASRFAVIVLVACFLVSALAVFGQEPPPSGIPKDEVRHLQDEVAEMRTELEAIKREMQARSVYSDPHQMMGQRTQGMMGRCWMGRMGGGTSSTDLATPSQSQVDALASFSEKHTLQHLTEEKKAEFEMPGEKSFERVCSQCHTLPSPDLHAAGDWPLIVNRMRGNMLRMHKPVPDDTTTQEIVAFLSANAR